MSYNVIEDGM